MGSCSSRLFGARSLTANLIPRHARQAVRFVPASGKYDPLALTPRQTGRLPASNGAALPIVVMVPPADTGTPFEGTPCNCHAAGGDGKLDIRVKFDEDIIEAFELEGEPHGTVIPVEIRGRLHGGGGFRAGDCIQIINRADQ